MNKTRGGFSQLSWEASLFGSFIAKSVMDVVLGQKISGYKQIDLDELITNDLQSNGFKKVS